MKILVATTQSQGARSEDFCCAVRAYLRLVQQSAPRGIPTAQLAAMAEGGRRSISALPIGTVVERTRGKTRARVVKIGI